jgi:hypothetical protein
MVVEMNLDARYLQQYPKGKNQALVMHDQMVQIHHHRKVWASSFH